ncbi:fructoselysine 6-kinase [Paenibacillus caseinilyticus]|uniref:fructoselysine 6-kinase n=1 Tax=Paenibacillus caseinilyticus TaxID=3098138 RepID=UPI0022B8FF7D|nr:fructoselysine 6-kinase [Paenibacillus caseinilyticus]MCZ8519900.1 fructoselysine 6-kinase [Paenibacillus caseinilyticus]
MRIVTVGDNCMDVYKASGKAYPGGNPVNVAVYAQGLGAEAAYIGRVGTDPYGDIMIRALREKGVDTTRLLQVEGATAVTSVEMEGNDRRFGDYDEGVNAQLSLSEEDMRFIQTYELIHSGIWGHAEKYFSLFQEKGLLTSFDFSDRLHHDLVTGLPPFVDYPFFSYSQDDDTIRQLLREVQGRGSRIAVATLGEQGSLAYDGEQYYRCGAAQADVVDTMGAGDSFIAGFLYGIRQGLPVGVCLELGSRTAAKTIGYFGAW